MEPKFVILGSGRSGSGYISNVLRKSGINCGHEEYWGMSGRKDNLDGDSSWLATFDRGFSGIKFAQFRNPISSIPSIFSSELSYSNYYMVRIQNVMLSGDAFIDSMRVWLKYNTEAWAHSQFWWRVEDVDQGIVEEIARRAKVVAKEVDRALLMVPNNFNSRPQKEFEWKDCKELEEVVALGKKMGYDL